MSEAKGLNDTRAPVLQKSRQKGEGKHKRRNPGSCPNSRTFQAVLDFDGNSLPVQDKFVSRIEIASPLTLLAMTVKAPQFVIARSVSGEAISIYTLFAPGEVLLI